MGAIEALGEKGSHPEGRAEAPHLPLFHSEEMVRWQEFRPLPLLVLCLRSQNSPNTFSLSGDCACWRATLAPDIFSNQAGFRVVGRESSFSAPRCAGMRPKVTSLGNQRALFTAGGVNFDLKLTINVPCSQVNATDNSNPRNWTNNMPLYALINTFYSSVFV